MNSRNFYQVLGVPRNASNTEIRTAFVRLAKHHHPDLAHRASELPGRLHQVQLAYHCLSDDGARVAHDRAIEENECLHVARQRRVRDRLRRYDGLHPQLGQADRETRRKHKVRWRLLLVAIVIVIILARLL